MADVNRIVIGNGGRDEPGLYISGIGENVLTCDAGHLTFNSTNKFISTVAGARAVVPAAINESVPGNVVIDTATSYTSSRFIHYGVIASAQNVHPAFSTSSPVTTNAAWLNFDIIDSSSGGITGDSTKSINAKYSLNATSKYAAFDSNDPTNRTILITFYNGSQNHQQEVYWQMLDISG